MEFAHKYNLRAGLVQSISFKCAILRKTRRIFAKTVQTNYFAVLVQISPTGIACCEAFSATPRLFLRSISDRIYKFTDTSVSYTGNFSLVWYSVEKIWEIKQSLVHSSQYRWLTLVIEAKLYIYIMPCYSARNK